jgi:myo-inositol-1(or 4)-monophosphatase
MPHIIDQSLRLQIGQRRHWLDGALDAGKVIILEALEGSMHVHHKGRIDLVTETDIAVETMLLDGITAHFPEDQVLAEESGALTSEGRFRWVIDPIDGTTNFSNRLPHFCISVALQYDETLVMCSIFDPVKDHHFRAERDRGAYLNDKRINVSQTPEMLNALLATGFSYDRHLRPDNNVGEFDYMLRRCRGLRRMGAAALDFAYVAAGWLDGYWEYRLKPWDAAAGILLVEEAGGVVTEIGGLERGVHSAHFCVSNGLLHAELVELVGSAPSIIGSGLKVSGAMT